MVLIKITILRLSCKLWWPDIKVPIWDIKRIPMEGPQN